MKEKILNVPNLISFYRLATFPLLAWMAATGRENLFAVFFSINLVSDILDGLIARAFNLSTKFGARLDSLADMSTYLTAFIGIYYFKWPDLRGHAPLLFTAMGFYFATYAVSYLRFGRFPSLHLYSCKVAAYLQGFFFFALFVWGFNPWMFRIALIWGMVSWSEEIIVLLLQRELKSDARGLYWVLKAR
ncbi:MAG: CDP-alcohol phosphatidyltransferase family protein [Fibrobacteres bacterium]|nr:CDP-alcohol phosphatidyltransferase family protein [Fibrobacterota bacterium]